MFPICLIWTGQRKILLELLIFMMMNGGTANELKELDEPEKSAMCGMPL